MGCHFLLCGIFLTQGLNPGLPHVEGLHSSVEQSVMALVHTFHTEKIYPSPANKQLCLKTGCHNESSLFFSRETQAKRTFERESECLLWKQSQNSEQQRKFCELRSSVIIFSSTLACKIPWTDGVTKSRTRLSNFTFTFHFHTLEKEMATHFLENPRDRGAWWTAIYGVLQSRTRLKWRSSSSSSDYFSQKALVKWHYGVLFSHLLKFR